MTPEELQQSYERAKAAFEEEEYKKELLKSIHIAMNCAYQSLRRLVDRSGKDPFANNY